MVRIGMVALLALGSVIAVGAEQLPSLFSEGRQPSLAELKEPPGEVGAVQPLPSLFGEDGQLPSILPEQGQAFLMGPLAMEDGEVGEAEPVPQASSGGGGGITPRRAFFYSVLVPGLGEWMAGAKKRGAIFFGIEALTVGLWASWKGKGNDAEDEFRAVADDNWDPLSYLRWRDSANARFSSITHALPCSSAVDFYVETGQFNGVGQNDQRYSCDESEIQQYYELIGKYDQFVSGWNDLARVDTGNAAEPTDVDSVESFISELRFDYEIQRDESNKFLKRASTITGLILINHVFSAIDAARVARARAEGVDEAALERRTRWSLVMQPWQRRHVPMVMAYKPFY